MRALPPALLALALAGCSWQVRATRASGLCPSGHVTITEARGNRWHASCTPYRGTFACSAANNRVRCSYVPICGNDGHDEEHEAQIDPPVRSASPLHPSS